jgi:hypothetical protein
MADFNGDGSLDLATANAGGYSVSVLLGDGRGGFRAANQFGVGANPVSVAVADFNNDRNLDLATIAHGISENKLSVLLGNGDGTFRPPVDTGTWDAPLTVAAGDFNADGNTDIVYTLFDAFGGEGRVNVRLGDGRGGFAAADEYELLQGGYPVGLAVADLNADGKLDVITANEEADTVSVLLGNGDGTLSYDYSGSSDFATGKSPRAVAVADFTGDGIPDLVTAGQTVDVLPGLRDGTFASPIRHSANGTGLTTVAAADFNGDGKLDVVTANPGAGTVSVLLGNGDGTLSSPIDHAGGSSPTAVAVGDFNGDGRPDVAAANRGSHAVSVLLNDGAWPDQNIPGLRIGEATVTEGNSGAVGAVFTVTLSAASTQTVTVQFMTANGTAVAGSDFQSTAGTLTFAPGETSKTIAVPVIGDRLGEPNETYFVNLSSPTNAVIADGQTTGAIVDDEPRISIGDVSRSEGGRGQTTLFTFTVTLSAAYDQPVTMSFRTVNGTAGAGSDYIANSGTLTFAPGQTTKTITIEVKGDDKREANETFYLDLFGNSSNSLFTKSRGIGTILNDD